MNNLKGIRYQLDSAEINFKACTELISDAELLEVDTT